MSTTLFGVMAIAEGNEGAYQSLERLWSLGSTRSPSGVSTRWGVAIGIVFEHFALKAALKPREVHWDTQFFPRADDSNHA